MQHYISNNAAAVKYERLDLMSKILDPSARASPAMRYRILAAGFVDAATLDGVEQLLADPDSWTQCWMLTSGWVRKPA